MTESEPQDTRPRSMMDLFESWNKDPRPRRVVGAEPSNSQQSDLTQQDSTHTKRIQLVDRIELKDRIGIFPDVGATVMPDRVFDLRDGIKWQLNSFGVLKRVPKQELPEQ